MVTNKKESLVCENQKIAKISIFHEHNRNPVEGKFARCDERYFPLTAFFQHVLK